VIIEIEPLDTLFFKNGKPFSIGEETWADGVFPPSPSVIYGALRTAYFSQNPGEIEKANQDDDPTKDLKIKGLYNKFENKIYLPLPSDIVQLKNRSRTEKNKEKRKKEYKVVSLDRKNRDEMNLISGMHDLSKILTYKEEVDSIEDGIILLSSFERYLMGNTEKITIRKLSDLVSLEPKIGIGRQNDTRTSEEGRLYRVGMRRFKDLKILIDFNGVNLHEEGFIKLGGEGKTVFYKKEENDIRVAHPEINGNIFKLYLSTPAIFNNGWLPDWIDEKTLEGECKGVKFKLLTAAIGRYISIGGFDMKKKMPKPMTRAIPPGSVYYFEIIEGNIHNIIDRFHGKPISEADTCKEGFGITYVGGVK